LAIFIEASRDMALALRWAVQPQGRTAETQYGAVHATEREQDGEPHRSEGRTEASATWSGLAGVVELGSGVGSAR
jgi:hypothetical protein